MEIANIGQSSSSSSQETSEPKCCWICLGTDGDDDNESNSEWVSPCKCRGPTRWAHQVCVLRWFNEILMTNIDTEVHCNHCHTKFIFVEDEVNYLVQVLNKLDFLANPLFFIMTCGTAAIIACSTAASYGAITMMQVMDQKQALTILENTDPLMLLLWLPTIPLSIYLVNMINWEETLLFYVQRFTSQLPWLRTIMPSLLCEPVDSLTSTVQFNSDSNSTTTLCAALLFPSTATVVGLLLFKNSSYSHLQKCLLGGLVYIAVKGVFRIYQRQQNIIRDRTRIVMDYSETDTEEIN